MAWWSSPLGQLARVNHSLSECSKLALPFVCIDTKVCPSFGTIRVKPTSLYTHNKLLIRIWFRSLQQLNWKWTICCNECIITNGRGRVRDKPTNILSSHYENQWLSDHEHTEKNKVLQMLNKASCFSSLYAMNIWNIWSFVLLFVLYDKRCSLFCHFYFSCTHWMSTSRPSPRPRWPRSPSLESKL